MNEMTGKQEMKNQGWAVRLITAVLEKTFAWLCQHEMGISAPETIMFMNYAGFDWGEAITYQSIARMKQDEVQID